MPTQMWTAAPRPAVEAAPLGTLPPVAPDPAAGAEAAADPGGAAAAPDAPAPAPGGAEWGRAKQGAPRHRPERPRRTGPGRAAAAPAAAPAAQTRGPRPAPNRTYDMAPLCAAARGTVDPAIVALCH
ncbi:hypothetical protein [Streptomyces sp. NBC_00096]|uniref:hypothetical protein n=1 Tax=Streptomyces sp. NBC_00096 TaxID=2975650 RepID=UPI00324C9E74